MTTPRGRSAQGTVPDRESPVGACVRAPGAVPVSLTLPIREAPYESKGLHPFFENLLPERWLLEIATAKLKISKDDAFGLLLATCADCVGAVEVRAAS